MSVQSVLDFLGSWLGGCWEFFQLDFPLFSFVTFGDIYLTLALIGIVIRVVKRTLNSNDGGGNNA